MELNKELAAVAKKNGICNEGYNGLLNAPDVASLVGMYLQYIDFCLSNEYPGADCIRKYLGEFNAQGVYLDQETRTLNLRNVVALGASDIRTVYNGYEAAAVYVKHDSVVTVEAAGNAFVVVDVFDNARVVLIASGNAKICANRYGGIVETYAGDRATVKVREKGKSIY